LSSASGDRRTVRGVLGLGLAGLALLVAASLLVPGGAVGTLRTVVGLVSVLVIPGWLIGRLADEEGDAIGRLIGGIVVTISVLAVCGYVASEHGLRVATAVFAVPLLVLVAITMGLGATGPPVRRAPLAPLLAALALGGAALTGALVTHLVLPAVPIEAAFSIEAAHAVASPSGVVVTVTVTQVHTTEPSQLSLYVAISHRPAAIAVVTPGQRQVTLRAHVAPGTTTCPRSIWVVAPNKAFLKPPVTCVGW
jgi:hypothetical protein